MIMWDDASEGGASGGEEQFVDDSMQKDGTTKELDGGKGDDGGKDGVLPDRTSALEKAMSELAGTMKTIATPKAQQKELSQDEKDELWGVYNPTKADPDFFKKFLRLPVDMDPKEAKDVQDQFAAIFGQMQQGFTRQALVGAKNLLAIELAKIREEYGPVSEYVSQSRAKEIRSDFDKQYPVFTETNEDGSLRYEKVINAVAVQLSASGKTFDSRESYFKALAESAAAAIQTLVPGFNLGATNKKTAVTTPRLPRSRVGGTGGSGGQGGDSTQTNAAATDDDAATLEWMK